MRFNKYQPYGPTIVQNILSVRNRAHYVARIVVENDTGIFHYSIASNIHHDPVRIINDLVDPGEYSRKAFYKRMKELENLIGQSFHFNGTNHDVTYSRFIYVLRGE